MRLEDVGIYKCFIEHRLQVVNDTGVKAPGVYTAGVGIAIDPETLLIVEQPKDQSCILLDNVIFECVAESPSDLTYQWYMNDKVIVGKIKIIQNREYLPFNMYINNV